MRDKDRRDAATGNARFVYYDGLFYQSAADHPYFHIPAKSIRARKRNDSVVIENADTIPQSVFIGRYLERNGSARKTPGPIIPDYDLHFSKFHFVAPAFGPLVGKDGFPAF